MDKPKCKLCGERHWSGEDHRWPAAVAPVDVTVETLHRPMPGIGPAPVSAKRPPPVRQKRVASESDVSRVTDASERNAQEAGVTHKRNAQGRRVTHKKSKPVLSPVDAVAVAPALKTDGAPLTKAERQKRYRDANPERVKEANRKRMARARAKAERATDA